MEFVEDTITIVSIGLNMVSENQSFEFDERFRF